MILSTMVNKEPKDLGIVIGTKEEKFWTEVLKQANMEIESTEKALKLQKGIKELAEMKIKEEKK